MIEAQSEKLGANAVMATGGIGAEETARYPGCSLQCVAINLYDLILAKLFLGDELQALR